MAFLLFALSIIYMFFGLSVLDKTAHSRGIPDLPLVAGESLLIFNILVNVAIHEAGHWIAGRAVGWKGLTFQIGPWRLVRTSRGWRVRFVKWLWGGAVAFSPVSLVEFRREDAVLVAGGPGASMLFGLICAVIARYAHSGAVFWISGDLAVCSFVGLITLIPEGRGPMRSDGAALWQLLRGGDQLARRQRYKLVNMSNGTELRPRDWPEDLMRPLLDGPLPCLDRHDGYLGYVYLMDLGNPNAALALLRGTLNTWRKGDPPEYALEAAWYAGVYAHDPVTCATWIGCAGKDTDPWVRLRAEAALALAEERMGDAARLCSEALTKLEDYPTSGYRAYETARTQFVIQACTLPLAPA